MIPTLTVVYKCSYLFITDLSADVERSTPHGRLLALGTVAFSHCLLHLPPFLNRPSEKEALPPGTNARKGGTPSGNNRHDDYAANRSSLLHRNAENGGQQRQNQKKHHGDRCACTREIHEDEEEDLRERII